MKPIIKHFLMLIGKQGTKCPSTFLQDDTTHVKIYKIKVRKLKYCSRKLLYA